MKEKYEEFKLSFEGKKLKPQAEKILGVIFLVLFIPFIGIDDFMFTIPTLVFIVGWGAIVFALGILLTKFGRGLSNKS